MIPGFEFEPEVKFVDMPIEMREFAITSAKKGLSNFISLSSRFYFTRAPPRSKSKIRKRRCRIHQKRIRWKIQRSLERRSR